MVKINGFVVNQDWRIKLFGQILKIIRGKAQHVPNFEKLYDSVRSRDEKTVETVGKVTRASNNERIEIVISKTLALT